MYGNQVQDMDLNICYLDGMEAYGPLLLAPPEGFQGPLGAF